MHELSIASNSGNVIAALAEAPKRGLVAAAMVGHDGGRVASEDLADHVVITRPQHIPRIQEAQASAWHVLRELIESEHHRSGRVDATAPAATTTEGRSQR